MADSKYENSAYEFAKIAITSLITTHSGSLIAVLSFCAQLKHDAPAQGVHNLHLSVASFWCGLVAAILCSVVTYINQYMLAFEKFHDDEMWIWFCALGCGALSFFALLAGGWFGYWAVDWIVK